MDGLLLMDGLLDAAAQVSLIGTLRLFLDSAFQQGLVTRTQLRELQAFVNDCHMLRPGLLGPHGSPANPLMNASFSAVRSSPGQHMPVIPISVDVTGMILSFLAARFCPG